MMAWLAGSVSVFDLILLNCGLALSQYIVLRAGVFSVATPALASIGAYTAGILTLRTDAGALVGIAAAAAMGTAIAVILSVPLARLRGVFQAIATVAFSQIVLSLALYATELTGGANGLNGIPRLIDTGALVLWMAALVYVLVSLSRSRIGYAFDAIRQVIAAARTGQPLQP